MIVCLVDRLQRIIATSTRISAFDDITREKSAQNSILLSISKCSSFPG